MFRILVRHCSSKAVAKAESKKSWNRDNKQLFGAVATKKTRKTKAKCDPEVKKIAVPVTSKPTEPVLGSEMHWMLGSAHNRKRMLAKVYDNTERIALNVKHPVEERQQVENKKSFNAILKVPLINRELNGELLEIPELSYNEVPSVGKILQATMSDSARNALMQWKLAKVEELGVDGFEKLQKENLGRGLRFHNMLQDYFTGAIDEASMTEHHPNYLVWKSVQSVLPEVNKQALFVEKRVQHPVLRYKGVVDCVSTIG